jgi:hypothetical protein
MANVMTQCMGGWCTRREKCAHYWAPRIPMAPPAERLCSSGDEVPTECNPVVTVPANRASDAAEDCEHSS